MILCATLGKVLLDGALFKADQTLTETTMNILADMQP